MTRNVIALNMQQLRQAIDVAAMPPDQQLASFPKGVDIPFEIANDFSNWCRWVLKCDEVDLTGDVRTGLVSLDELLHEMSGPHNAKLWTEDALRHDLKWEQVRQMARELQHKL